MQQLPNYPAGNNQMNSQPKNQQARGNVAAVEPYNHVPHAQSLHNNNFQVRQCTWQPGEQATIKP